MDQDIHIDKFEDPTLTPEQREAFDNVYRATVNMIKKVKALDEVTMPIDHFVEILALGTRMRSFQPYSELEDVIRHAGRTVAILDARVYAGRKNTPTYTALYGLEPERVLELYKQDARYATSALSRHTKLLVDKEDISTDVEVKYQAFLQELKQADDLRHPLTESESPWAKAHFAYTEASGHKDD